MESLIESLGPLALVVLALVDSTSVGTLVVPLILLVTGEGRAGRVAGRTLLYLAVIGVFYLLLGVALLAGLLPLFESLAPLLTAGPATVALALAGVGLVVWSHYSDPETIRKRGGDPEASARRWTDRARRASGRPRVLIGLALLAGVIEAATMIPYLVAMGLIADRGVGLGGGSLILVGYCLVMVLPAALLCAVRAAVGARGDRLLDKVHRWAVKHAASAFSWGTGIIGVLILVRTVGPALAVLRGD
ncbi:GAP family protein [Citricoccus sp. GCM10030269]|uniref:GAP family protein n=1 Tax=Citricoccus sp. GCM10030269 TaxID=3273388 RepID=UPI00366CBCF5